VSSLVTISDTTAPVAVAQNVTSFGWFGWRDGAGDGGEQRVERQLFDHEHLDQQECEGPWTRRGYGCVDATNGRRRCICGWWTRRGIRRWWCHRCDVSDTTAPVAVAQNVSKTLDGSQRDGDGDGGEQRIERQLLRSRTVSISKNNADRGRRR